MKRLTLSFVGPKRAITWNAGYICATGATTDEELQSLYDTGTPLLCRQMQRCIHEPEIDVEMFHRAMFLAFESAALLDAFRARQTSLREFAARPSLWTLYYQPSS